MEPEHEHTDPAAIPKWVAPPFLVCESRLEAEARFVHLAIRGLDQLATLPKLLEILYAGPDHHEEGLDQAKRLGRAKADAELVKKEASTDFPLLHSHSIVAVWGILEVLAEDFAVTWLRNVPSAWQGADLTKIRVPLSTLQLTDDERSRFVLNELQRSTGADLRKGAGKLKSVLSPFDLAPPVGANIQRALHELCQVRNVIVHGAGRVDQKLLDECPWLEFVVGQTINIQHSIWGWYVRAATRYAERVFNQAIVRLGLKGCECPGMDEISPRPKPATHPLSQSTA